MVGVYEYLFVEVVTDSEFIFQPRLELEKFIEQP